MFFLYPLDPLDRRRPDEGDHRGGGPPIDLFADLAAKVQSRFFTMDVARRKGGDWTVVELGDAQVAGMPERADVQALYRGLASSLRE
jgi:hypothetical protein